MPFVGGPIAVVATDENGNKLTSSTPLPVNPAEGGAANMAPGQVSVTPSATALVSVRSTRRAVVITNTHASATLYLGGATVTATTGHALPAGNSVSIPFTGALYGITASVTLTATFMEVYD